MTASSNDEDAPQPKSISNEATRDTITDAVNKIPKGGGTCLHIGVRESLKALRNYNLTTGGMVVFLTDGEQNCGGIEWIKEIIDEVLMQKTLFIVQ